MCESRDQVADRVRATALQPRPKHRDAAAPARRLVHSPPHLIHHTVRAHGETGQGSKGPGGMQNWRQWSPPQRDWVREEP